jgi:hypothetical protein
MTLATLQQLRSSTLGTYPPNLEPGQIAFNIAEGNFDVNREDYNIFMFVGNGSNTRLTEDGTVLTTAGDAGRGWVRYSLAGRYQQGGNIFGNLNIKGGVLKVESFSNIPGELVVPTENVAPSISTNTASIRYNTTKSILQAWNGLKWDTTSKVTVSDTAPANPSNGDMWLNVTDSVNPTLYVYVVPSSGPAAWKTSTGSTGATALQPGNGVTSNDQNQIDIINPGDY